MYRSWYIQAIAVILPYTYVYLNWSIPSRNLATTGVQGASQKAKKRLIYVWTDIDSTERNLLGINNM